MFFCRRHGFGHVPPLSGWRPSTRRATDSPSQDCPVSQTRFREPLEPREGTMRLFSRLLIFTFVLTNSTSALAQAQSPTPKPAPSEAAPLNQAASPGILVPGGTIVTVSLDEPLSSATAKEGDQLSVHVTKEVDAAGFVVIPVGSPGHATVSTVDQAGSNGHGGQLGLTIDWVYSQDGGKIELSPANHASENGQQKGAASTATILSYVLLGPLGLFAHNFVRGRDVTIDTKHVFSVFVDRDVHVLTTTPATSPRAGFDK